MRIVVTGAAGFIGSQLSERALIEGHTVVGVDCLTDYYDIAIKQSALRALAEHPAFTHVNNDLLTADIASIVDGADVIFHLAGQPGVRLSWADGFGQYVQRNVVATQRLLEAVKTTKAGRVVYASSSSIYGNTDEYPTTEACIPAPYSPYGVTKLAGEHLCGLYSANWGVATIALRYFTVYGPRQRPDMGINRFLNAAGRGVPVPLFGDGEQVRDFTFVNDVVAANMAAAQADVAPGTFMNIAGGGSISVNGLLAIVESVVGRPIQIERLPAQPGDVRATGGSIERAQKLLDWQPQTSIEQGVAAQWDWQRQLESMTTVRS